MVHPSFTSALHRILGYDPSQQTESTVTEALRRASRLVSDRFGIISKVEFQRMRANEPPVYWAHSSPARYYPGSRTSIAYHGFGASTEPERAIIKAIGESIERYCSLPPTHDALMFGSYASVGKTCTALAPEAFTLFSDEQYANPTIPFSRPTSDSQIHWVKGTSLTSGDPVLVPAFLVYAPYDPDARGYPPEPRLALPISTGLACGPTYAAAVYNGLLEVLERDAFMLSWRHELSMPMLDTSKVQRPLTKALLQAVDKIPVSCVVKLATVDIAVNVVLVMLTSENGTFPLFAMGAGADFDPEQALIRALEEALLCYSGLCRIESPGMVDLTAEPESAVNPLALHGLAHAVDNSLQGIRCCLEESTPFADDFVTLRRNGNLGSLVQELNRMDHEVIVVDLTQADIDEAGFKVVRVLVPGLQPLDIDLRWPYLGLKRSVEVAERFGGNANISQVSAFSRLPLPFA